MTMKKQLEVHGYENIRQLEDGRWIGTYKLMFTTGLFVGLDDIGYACRYCFEDYDDACESVKQWNGRGHPPGNWIKRKGGIEGDYSNPNYKSKELI